MKTKEKILTAIFALASLSYSADSSCKELWQKSNTQIFEQASQGSKDALSLFAFKIRYEGSLKSKNSKALSLFINGMSNEIEGIDELESDEQKLFLSAKKLANPITTLVFGTIPIRQNYKNKSEISIEAIQNALNRIQEEQVSDCAPIQYLIGTIYKNGWSSDNQRIEKNNNKAKQWLEKAAKNGYKSAFVPYGWIKAEDSQDTACAYLDLGGYPEDRDDLECPINNELSYSLIDEMSNNGNLNASIIMYKKLVKEKNIEQAKTYLDRAEAQNLVINNLKISETINEAKIALEKSQIKNKVIANELFDSFAEEKLLRIFEKYDSINSGAFTKLQNEQKIKEINDAVSKWKKLKIGTWKIGDVEEENERELTKYGYKYKDYLMADVGLDIEAALQAKIALEACEKCWTKVGLSYVIDLQTKDKCGSSLYKLKNGRLISLNLKFKTKDKGFASSLKPNDSLVVEGTIKSIEISYKSGEFFNDYDCIPQTYSVPDSVLELYMAVEY